MLGEVMEGKEGTTIGSSRLYASLTMPNRLTRKIKRNHHLRLVLLLWEVMSFLGAVLGRRRDCTDEVEEELVTICDDGTEM